ncbi:MAG: DUF1674 domain-containing protein [Sphingomonadales bacterium]|nr:DUF1674 domain-containing protein [Sphingomonadales bacterium]
MGKRPPHVKPPAHLSKSPPVPEPKAVEHKPLPEKDGRPDPVRYGDWEKKGIAIDFDARPSKRTLPTKGQSITRRIQHQTANLQSRTRSSAKNDRPCGSSGLVAKVCKS